MAKRSTSAAPYVPSPTAPDWAAVPLDRGGRRGRRGRSADRLHGGGGVDDAAGGALAGEPRDGRHGRDDRRADLCGGRLRVGGRHQGHEPGHVRRGHRRAAVARIAVVGRRRIDAHARRGHLHGRRAVVRERREPVRGIGGGHGDTRRSHGIGGVGAHGVIVRTLVARGGDAENSSIASRRDRVAECRRATASAPAVVRGDDVHAICPPHHRRVVQRGDRGARRTAAARVEKLQPHDRHLPVDPCDAGAIVADRADRAGHMGAVRVVVEHVGGVGGEVPAEDVVDKTVAIVVDAVACRLAGIAPDVRGQIRMVVIDAGVDHGDDHRPRAGGDIPRRRGVDVGIGKPARLRRVVESPEAIKGGIVWKRCRRSDDPVGFDGADARGGSRPAEDVGRRGPGRHQREESLAER